MSQHIFNLHHACDWGKLLAIPVEHIFHTEEAKGEDEEADPFSSPLPESPPWKAPLQNLRQAHLQSHFPYHNFHPWTEALKCNTTKHLFFLFEWTIARRVPLPPILGGWRKYRLATALPPSIGGNPPWTARPSWSGWVLQLMQGRYFFLWYHTIFSPCRGALWGCDQPRYDPDQSGEHNAPGRKFFIQGHWWS